jgi:YD repeat-containing protein
LCQTLLTVLIENEETYTVYDGLSRVIKQGQGNREQMIVYDAAGNVTETFDPYEIANGTYRGRVMTYNSGGKVLTESDLDGNLTRYEYDQRDNLLRIEDPRQSDPQYAGDFCIDFVYDDWNRLVWGKLPAWYDPELGRLKEKNITTIQYDLRGNAIQQDLPNGTSLYQYFNSRNQAIAGATIDQNGLATALTYTVFNGRGEVSQTAK